MQPCAYVVPVQGMKRYQIPWHGNEHLLPDLHVLRTEPGYSSKTASVFS